MSRSGIPTESSENELKIFCRNSLKSGFRFFFVMSSSGTGENRVSVRRGAESRRNFIRDFLVVELSQIGQFLFAGIVFLLLNPVPEYRIINTKLR